MADDLSFNDLLASKLETGRHVCVGLDSDIASLPKQLGQGTMDAQLEFNCAIVDATKDIVAAYKPNSAFYEGRGSVGLEALAETVKYIRAVARDVPIVLDVKRGDIDSTNAGYASYAFDVIGAHAITVHPYLGSESVSNTLLVRPDRGVFVLCRTSNRGASEFQDLPCEYEGATRPLYMCVAMNVRDKWNARNNCGLVVGATYPDELAAVRAEVPELPLLIPGIGAQGGDLEATIAAATSGNVLNAIVNSSRGVIFAYQRNKEEPEPLRYVELAKQATTELDSAIRACIATTT